MQHQGESFRHCGLWLWTHIWEQRKLVLFLNAKETNAAHVFLLEEKCARKHAFYLGFTFHALSYTLVWSSSAPREPFGLKCLVQGHLEAPDEGGESVAFSLSLLRFLDHFLSLQHAPPPCQLHGQTSQCKNHLVQERSFCSKGWSACKPQNQPVNCDYLNCECG